MSTPDLDELRGRWAEEGRRIDATLELDVDAVRAALARRTVSAFRWHSRWLLGAWLFDGVALVSLVVFIVDHWAAWGWVGLASALLPLVVAEFVVDLRQWLAVRQLDLDAPVLQVRASLDAVRRRRVQLVKWILLLSVLLWWPFVLVLLEGLLGVDLLRSLHPSVLWVSAGVGLAFIPLGEMVARWGSRRFSGSPGFQRFLEDMCGGSWQRATGHLDTRERFEHALVAGSAGTELQSLAIPKELASAIDSLRLRLLFGILVCAALMALLGLFNAAHAKAGMIIPGVLLNLVVVANMVAQILHRHALARGSGGVSALCERLTAVIAVRRRVGTATLLASPLLLLPLAIVLGKAILGLDLLTTLPLIARLAAAAAALGTSIALAQRYRRDPTRFAPGLVELFCSGALARTRALLARLQP